jgi:hypothetical protein
MILETPRLILRPFATDDLDRTTPSFKRSAIGASCC